MDAQTPMDCTILCRFIFTTDKVSFGHQGKSLVNGRPAFLFVCRVRFGAKQRQTTSAAYGGPPSSDFQYLHFTILQSQFYIRGVYVYPCCVMFNNMVERKTSNCFSDKFSTHVVDMFVYACCACFVCKRHHMRHACVYVTLHAHRRERTCEWNGA